MKKEYSGEISKATSAPEEETLEPHEVGLRRYLSWLSRERPQTIELDGVKYLKIYRGLIVPQKTIYSGDERGAREPNIINLQKPGTDWSPIRAFTGPYSHTLRDEESCTLSALVPLDHPGILRASQQDNQDLGEDEWGRYEDRPIHVLTDALIIKVPPHLYNELKDLQIEQASPGFSRATIIK